MMMLRAFWWRRRRVVHPLIVFRFFVLHAHRVCVLATMDETIDDDACVCVVDLLARVGGGVRRSGRARACLRMRMECILVALALKVVLIHTVYPYKMYPSNVLVSRFTDDATGGTRAYASRMDVCFLFRTSFVLLVC